METPPNLFEILTEDAKDRVPVAYRAVEPIPIAGAPELRLVESRSYRARGYFCKAFYKPVSKCVAPEPD
ncbi:MAG: hypothetical protein JF614_23825 [Acidobacteria bacterium]|nr:hypothetical protein [Acidobacteriota bacterium]